jgi:hypothetical protein
MYSPRRLDTTLLHYTLDGEEQSIFISELIKEANLFNSDNTPCVFEDFVFDDDGNKM